MVRMEADIHQRIARDFGDDLPTALAIVTVSLASADGVLNGRVLRAIVFLSQGHLDKLRTWVEAAQRDWRDVLMQAEYEKVDGNLHRVRDFN